MRDGVKADGEKIYHPIPSPQEIAIKIGVSPDTVEKDMRKLKKLGLYDYVEHLTHASQFFFLGLALGRITRMTIFLKLRNQLK